MKKCSNRFTNLLLIDSSKIPPHVYLERPTWTIVQLSSILFWITCTSEWLLLVCKSINSLYSLALVAGAQLKCVLLLYIYSSTVESISAGNEGQIWAKLGLDQCSSHPNSTLFWLSLPAGMLDISLGHCCHISWKSSQINY